MEKLIKYALEKGATDIEIFIREALRKGVTLETNKFRGEVKKSVGVVIRVAINKKVASQYLTAADEKYIREAVDRAIEMAKSVGEDPYWSGLPTPKKPYIRSLYLDGRIEDMDINMMTNELREIRNNLMKKDDRVKGILSSLEAVTQQIEYYNSNGIAYTEDLSGEVFEIGVTAREGDRYTSTFRIWRSRRFFDDFISISIETADKALEFLEARKLSERVNKVIFEPLSIASILFHSLYYGISADYVLEGISPLKNKINMEIASPDVDMVDDGTIPGGWRTSMYDDEGIPRRRTILIEKGILRNYLHNHYTAMRMNKESTGNAERRGTTLTVRPSNLVLKPGRYELHEIMKDIDKGVYITGYPLSAHTINVSTGDASVVFQETYYIEKGELKYPLHPVTLSGNIYQMLRRMRLTKYIQETPYSIYTPHVYTDEFTVK